jgi:FG-GAP-like repeat/Abnormal spindle-like microcephaly-assoc'd, ASPM-SPD-2-Hydin/FG-GAP repeat
MAGLRIHVLFLIVCISSLLSAQSNSVPLVNQAFSPASAAPGSSGFTLAVSGTGFASGAVAEWNGSSRLTEVISSSLLQVTIKTSDLEKPGTASIKVVNPAPGGGASNVVFFPVREAFTSLAMVGNEAFSGATAVAIGDFNNDGKLDVVWGAGSTLNVSLGKGDGTFQSPIASSGLYRYQEIITGDFNGDGNLDVATTDGYGDLTVYLGNGDGTLTNSWSNTFLNATGWVYLAAADFNQDGHLDIYTTGSDLGAQWFQILLGKGDGTFTALADNWTEFKNGYGSPAVGDFNGDGTLDLAVPDGENADIFLGNGDGTFQSFGTVAIAAERTVSAADMNRDGKLDLVGDLGCIFLGNGNGTFTEAGCGDYLGPMFGVADFNGDGNLDAAYYGGKGVGVSLGTGTGNFSGGATFAFNGTNNSVAGGIGDFNDDGMLDVVIGNGFLFLQTTASISPTNLRFGYQNVETKSSPQTVTLTNVGTSALVIHKISISGTDAIDFSQTNGCGTSVAAGSSCTISVVFGPKAGGTLSALLNVSYEGVGSPQQVSLGGTGVTPPTVTLTPSTLTFATQLVGTPSAEQTAALTNTGDQAVSISGISITGPFSETNNCSSSLGILASCQIQVEFQPTAIGPVTGTLSISDDAASSPQKAGLQGTGTVIQLSPVSANFGDQKVGTVSSPAPITVTNTGSTAVAISSIGFTGADAGDFLQTNNCGKSVASHASCTVNVRFKPASTGARSASLNVNDNGGGSPQTVALEGTGT